MSGFQAKIKLGLVKNGPLTHTGFRGRTLKKGESFMTTSLEEANYYKAQPGFSVTVLRGKLPGLPDGDVERRRVATRDSLARDDDESDGDVDGYGDDDADEETDDEEDEARDAEVTGAYERADLKKMSRDELLLLIKNDDELPLKLKDIPKKASKKEVIGYILDAQQEAHKARQRGD